MWAECPESELDDGRSAPPSVDFRVRPFRAAPWRRKWSKLSLDPTRPKSVIAQRLGSKPKEIEMRALPFLILSAVMTAAPSFAQDEKVEAFTLFGSNDKVGSNSASVSLGLNYYVRPDLSVELTASRFEQTLPVRTPGFGPEVVTFSTVDRTPLTASLVYHHNGERFRPFLGAGVGWADGVGFDSLANGSEDFTGLMLSAGVDILIRDSHFLKLDYRRNPYVFDGESLGSTISAGMSFRF